jgi:hypothetical protein
MFGLTLSPNSSSLPHISTQALRMLWVEAVDLPFGRRGAKLRYLHSLLQPARARDWDILLTEQ